jgi:hypothetical protein
MEFQEALRTDRLLQPDEFNLPIAAGKTIDGAVAAAPTTDAGAKWGQWLGLLMSLQKWYSAV